MCPCPERKPWMLLSPTSAVGSLVVPLTCWGWLGRSIALPHSAAGLGPRLHFAQIWAKTQALYLHRFPSGLLNKPQRSTVMGGLLYGKVACRLPLLRLLSCVSFSCGENTHSSLRWVSARQCRHRAIAFARPVKASLYNAGSIADHSRVFRLGACRL